MRLTVLGSGTAVPVPDRFPAGYLLEHGDSKVMVDCARQIAAKDAEYRALYGF